MVNARKSNGKKETRDSIPLDSGDQLFLQQAYTSLQQAQKEAASSFEQYQRLLGQIQGMQTIISQFIGNFVKKYDIDVEDVFRLDTESWTLVRKEVSTDAS